MNKTELIEAIAKKSGLKRTESERALSAAIEALTEAMAAGEKVQLMGFGSFEVKERAARTVRNPQTGEPVEVAAYNTVQFHAGKGLKDAVSGK